MPGQLADRERHLRSLCQASGLAVLLKAAPAVLRGGRRRSRLLGLHCAQPIVCMRGGQAAVQLLRGQQRPGRAEGVMRLLLRRGMRADLPQLHAATAGVVLLHGCGLLPVLEAGRGPTARPWLVSRRDLAGLGVPAAAQPAGCQQAPLRLTDWLWRLGLGGRQQANTVDFQRPTCSKGICRGCWAGRLRP